MPRLSGQVGIACFKHSRDTPVEIAALRDYRMRDNVSEEKVMKGTALISDAVCRRCAVHSVNRMRYLWTRKLGCSLEGQDSRFYETWRPVPCHLPNVASILRGAGERVYVG